MKGVWRGLVLAGLLVAGLSLPGIVASSHGQPVARHLSQDLQIAPPVLGRGVHGTVRNAVHQPMAQAMVYLKNVNNKVEHTVITGNDGNYTFYDLKKDTTYEVYAVWKGHKSAIRTDSQYNPQANIRLDLTIPVE